MPTAKSRQPLRTVGLQPSCPYVIGAFGPPFYSQKAKLNELPNWLHYFQLLVNSLSTSGKESYGPSLLLILVLPTLKVIR